MSNEKIKQIKRHGYHSNRTLLLIRDEAIKKGLSLYRVYDTGRMSLRNHLLNNKKKALCLTIR